MNAQEIQALFSPENTAHLLSHDDEEKYLLNMVQLSWFEQYPDLSEVEASLRSEWFRKGFLPTDEARDLLGRFKEEPKDVLDRMEQLYLASVTKH